jgi:hypothetical protein
MSFQQYILTSAEMKALDGVYAAVRKNKAIFNSVRAEFKSLLEELGEKAKPYLLARLFLKPSKAKYKYVLLLYKYTLMNLRFDIKYKATLESSRAIDEKLTELIDAGKLKEQRNRASLLSMQHGLEIDEDVAEIQERFYKKYFGYRRSSTPGGIIRFYLSIEPVFGDRRRVSFVNEYVRRNVQWVVKGSGLYINQVLYLYGNARSKYGERNLGLRFFALRPLKETQILIGPVITMNSEEPVAARMVLIPIGKHERARYENESDDDFMRRLLDQNAEAEKGGPEKLAEDIFPPLQDAFSEIDPNADATMLLQLINNSTYTVLKGKPDWSTLDAAATCDRFVKMRERYLAHFNDDDLRAKKNDIKLMKKYLEQEAGEIETAAAMHRDEVS